MLSSPKFSKRNLSKKGGKSSKNKTTPEKSSSKRLNVLLSVTSSPTSRNPMHLTDVMTSEDVLNEENATTVSRKINISRPIDQSPDPEEVKSLERRLSSPSKGNLPNEDIYPNPKETFRRERSYSTKAKKQKKTTDVSLWRKTLSEKSIHLGTPVLGISSTNSTEFVTCSFDGFIRVHDMKTGEVVSSLQTSSSTNNRQKFQTAMTRQGDFIVASGDAVTLWSKQGRLLHEYGKKQFQFCKNLFLDDDGIVAVTDADNNCAAMMSLDGNWFHQFGNKEDLSCPTGVTMLSNGDVAVADWSCRIHLFDRHGRYKFAFSEKGKQDGSLDLPYGLTCDSKDNILVADWWNNRVSVFSRNGRFLKHVLTASDGIKMPAYICLPYEGNQLILSEFGSSEIKLFSF